MSTRITHKPTVAERVEDLACIEDVDAMLRDGVSPGDVAAFIQESEQLLKEINRKTLVNVLMARREHLPEVHPAVVEEFPAEEAPDYDAGEKPRFPASLAKTMYRRMTRGLDELIELQSMYLSQRDRIGWLMKLEQDSGIPLEPVSDEMDKGRKMLVDLAKIRSELQGGHSQAGGASLDVQGYSRETVAVLSRPESRRRIVSIVERLTRLRVEEHGGPDTMASASGE